MIGIGRFLVAIVWGLPFLLYVLVVELVELPLAIGGALSSAGASADSHESTS